MADIGAEPSPELDNERLLLDTASGVVSAQVWS